MTGRNREDSGFTIVELVIAIALAAFLFAALGAVMASSMSALSIQKSRLQGNDLATIGIEDLQRLDYDSLGLCTAPSGTAPSQLTDTVFLPNCGSATAFGPCSTGSPPAISAPASTYSCTRRNIPYTVRRYIAFGDLAHTEKLLAVIVEWDDKGGHHQVSQQSSLRIPSQNATVGDAPPTFLTAATGVNPATMTVDPATGMNTSAVNIVAKTSGLTSTSDDSVVAVFETVGPSARQQQSVSLTSTDASTWTGQLPTGAYSFGSGEQYVVVTATRKSDGKVNSYVIPTPLAISGRSTPATPTLTMVQAPPAAATIDAKGSLTTSFSVAVQTTGISPVDSVRVNFETLTGAATVALSPDPYLNGGCSLTSCTTTWRATITPESSYRFKPTGSGPARKFYFSALQVPGSSFGVDGSATAVLASSGTTFS